MRNLKLITDGIGPSEREVPWRALISKAICALPNYRAKDEWPAVDDWSVIWLSGGLSGAFVAELLPHRPTLSNARRRPEHLPLIAKVDTLDRIQQELHNYRKIPYTKMGATISGARAALLLWPRNGQASMVLSAPASGIGYSVLLYEHAVANWDGTEERLVWPLDEYLKHEIVREGAVERGASVIKPVAAAVDLVRHIFHSDTSPAKEKRVRRLDLAKVPWSDFLPLALMACSLCTDWQPFVEDLQQSWEKKAAKSPHTVFVPRLCHGDLRCANLLTVQGRDGREIALIDYGAVNANDCPLSDYARLEADILLRVALSRSCERTGVMTAVLEADGALDQPLWTSWDALPTLRIIATIRSAAARAVDSALGSSPRDHAAVYRTFLFGHAVRMARRHDPALNEQHHRIWYLWFVLSLAHRLMGGSDNLSTPRSVAPILSVGTDAGCFLAEKLKAGAEPRKEHCNEDLHVISVANGRDSNAESAAFLFAYLRIIAPDTPLHHTHSRLISDNYDKLLSDAQGLHTCGEWSALLQLRVRLREYFEYSGRYCDGVRLGLMYVDAATKLGRHLEALWALVKDVAWLQILSGAHGAGRRDLVQAIEIARSLEALKVDAAKECLFYCYRYMGVSYQRDLTKGDLERAKSCFDQAALYASHFIADSVKRRELEGRLLRNRGNIAEQEGLYDQAIDFYQRSYDIFRGIGDAEHIAIVQIQMAKALISTDKLDDVPDTLQAAKNICIEIGWVEGQARADEQFARYYECLGAAVTASEERSRHFQKARDAAVQSELRFLEIDQRIALGRIQELRGRIERALHGRVTAESWRQVSH